MNPKSNITYKNWIIYLLLSFNNIYITKRQQIIITSIVYLQHHQSRGSKQARQCSFNQRHQTFIHKNQPLPKFIIKYIHESSFYCGREQALAILINKYWIQNVKRLIRKVITDCLHCQKASAAPSPPFRADIAEDRLQHNHKSFTNTGTGYFGPF